MKKFNFWLILFILITWTACDSPKETETNAFKPSENPPSEKEKLPKERTDYINRQNFSIRTGEKQNITTAANMQLEIPENCFVDENGNAIQGDVELSVQEFYSPSEIILSKLPMYYTDEKGNSFSFESDGMFTLTASHNNKEVFIAEDKSITARTFRTKTGEGFEFYALENGQWIKETSNQIEPVYSQDMEVKFEKPQRPVMPEKRPAPVKFNPAYYTVEDDDRFEDPDQKKSDYYYGSVKQITIDINKNPWMLDSDKWKFQRSLGVILKKVSNDWRDADTVEYDIVYAVRGNKRYKELYNQYLDDSLNYNARLSAYKKDLAAFDEDIKAYLEQRMNQGKLTKTELFQELVIGKFGTYNIDRYYTQPKNLIVEKQYEIEKPFETTDAEKVFMLAMNEDGIITPVDLSYYPGKLRMNKNDKNALLVMKDDKFYGMDHKRFTETLQGQQEDKTITLALNQMEVESVKSFDETLQGLF